MFQFRVAIVQTIMCKPIFAIQNHISSQRHKLTPVPHQVIILEIQLEIHLYKH